ncbi:MAG TPA: SDR family oxidoreductase [Polyangiaceae bacterium]|nr:SDR family oxidoreductase [Polyangiaceae bacterium]
MSVCSKPTHVFLTGATGHLGGELLVALSQQEGIQSITCLVRARSGEPGVARLARVFALRGDRFDPARVACLEGDLTDPELAATLRGNPALADTDLVIHCAAETSFSPFESAAITEINVGGTRRLLGWASGLQRLATFVYVGTAAAVGAERRGLLGEDDAQTPGARHVVPYTASKAEAEALVARHLPAHQVLVVRPSILLGDSGGRVPRSVDVGWAVAAMNRLRLLPVDPHLPLDIIPADFAAHAIVALIGGARRHAVYHVSAGPEATTSAAQLAPLLAERYPALPPFRFVEPELRPLLARWARGVLPPSPQLAPHASYLAHIGAEFPDRHERFAIVSAASVYFEFMQLGQVFDNRRARTDAPLAMPPPAHLYLRPALESLDRIDLLAGVHDRALTRGSGSGTARLRNDRRRGRRHPGPPHRTRRHLR